MFFFRKEYAQTDSIVVLHALSNYIFSLNSFVHLLTVEKLLTLFEELAYGNTYIFVKSRENHVAKFFSYVSR